MIAKKTSKNQLTLPKKIADCFPGVEYFDVRADESRITLVPAAADNMSWSRLLARPGPSVGRVSGKAVGRVSPWAVDSATAVTAAPAPA